MRFVCRYCKCYWDLTVLNGYNFEHRDPLRRIISIREQIEEMQLTQCPVMLNGTNHSLFGELE